MLRRFVRGKSWKIIANKCFIIGILIGLLLTLLISKSKIPVMRNDNCKLKPNNVPSIIAESAHLNLMHSIHQDIFDPHVNLASKPMSAKKLAKNIIRPRYYSSELGIREKLFVGVLTAQDRIDTLAVAFNKTTANLVDKIKFFINAGNVRSNARLKNIVGFTDVREHLRPFHVLKYIADNYVDDYDFFLIVTDNVYVNIRRLLDEIRHISISFDIYMGQVERESAGSTLNGTGRYCDMRSGIILSSSVIRKIRSNLDWCVRNAVSSKNSFNVGRCVLYSTHIDACQDSFQGIEISSYELQAKRIHRDLHVLSSSEQFNRATFLHPINQMEDTYTLHKYFSKLHLVMNKYESKVLTKKSALISNGSLSNTILELRWPLGVANAVRPESRHDIQPWKLINATHIIMPDQTINVCALTSIEVDDFRYILNRTILHAQIEQPDMIYQGLHTAYRRFDPIRGMDYRIFLRYSRNGEESMNHLRSFEAVKPTGRVEIVSSPYVTESTRITIILPVFEHLISNAWAFIQRYEQTCMISRENTFLMLVFVYGPSTPNRGDSDPYGQLKSSSLNLTDFYRAQPSRITWLSIRLSTATESAFGLSSLNESILLGSTYALNNRISIVVTDLALRKIGLRSLILLANVDVSLKPEFLNRVRMNTIEGFQVFSPIGFQSFPCGWVNLCTECETCDVSSQSGYFDMYSNDVVAFYSQDYVDARKQIRDKLPIVYFDNDINNILMNGDMKGLQNVVDIFMASHSQLHMLRAIEPQLRFVWGSNMMKNSQFIEKCPLEKSQKMKCRHLSAKKHFGDVLLNWANSHSLSL